MSMAADHHRCGDREGLRSLLEARRRQLTEDVQLRIARIRDNGFNAAFAQEPDAGDPCDLDVRLLEITMATLRRVDLALDRLDDGRYGRCTRCRATIDAVRLHAMPFALR